MRGQRFTRGDELPDNDLRIAGERMIRDFLDELPDFDYGDPTDKRERQQANWQQA